MPPQDNAIALPLVLCMAIVVGGSFLTYVFDPRLSLKWRVADGACLGAAGFGLIGFVLTRLFGLSGFVVATAGVMMASPAALLVRPRYRSLAVADVEAAWSSCRPRWARLRPMTVARALLYALLVLLAWQIAERTMFVRPDGIYTGVSHNIGDLPFHLSVINRFVYSGNVPPEHPSFAGASFTYPFLTDFLAAIFVVAGVPVREVLVWSTLTLCIVLMALFYRWTLHLTGRRAVAWLSLLILFLNGGLGWWILVQEMGTQEATLAGLLANLPHDYTITYDTGYRWGNIVTTLLVTQRGLLLGLPLALIVFENWWQATGQPVDDARTRMAAAGVTAGLLPLVHTYTFAVVIALGACMVLFTRNLRPWRGFFFWALLVGLPQILWLGGTSLGQAQAFIEPHIGWDRGEQNVVLFWLKNAGVFITILVVALFWRGRRPPVPRQLLAYYLPFTVCFIVPNLVRLAPWIWDNTKVLIYWYVASTPIVALLIIRMAEGRWWRRAVATALVLSLTAAGALDVWRVASGAFQARIFDTAGLDFAGMVFENTAPASLILHAPVPNHPVILTGRRSVMGYPGHVWSHGLDYRSREAEINRIYSGGADAVALIRRYGIGYVVIGPLERARMRIDAAFFGRYEYVGEASGYRLYRTTIADERGDGEHHRGLR